MARNTTFIIENDAEKDFDVFVEPEGVMVRLVQNEKIVVTDKYEEAPVTLRISRDDDGNVLMSVWPGDGDTKVEKNGVDVLEIG